MTVKNNTIDCNEENFISFTCFDAVFNLVIFITVDVKIKWLISMCVHVTEQNQIMFSLFEFFVFENFFWHGVLISEPVFECHQPQVFQLGVQGLCLFERQQRFHTVGLTCVWNPGVLRVQHILLELVHVSRHRVQMFNLNMGVNMFRNTLNTNLCAHFVILFDWFVD